jgi:hypothetical protein
MLSRLVSLGALTSIVLGTVGCAGAPKAGAEGVSRGVGVSLRCPSPPHLSVAAASESGRSLSVRVAATPRPLVVGELFRWTGGQPAVLDGDEAEEALASDAAALLAAAGYAPRDGPDLPALTLAFRVLETRQRPAKLTELEGTTAARVDVRVELAAGGGRRTWDLSGTGTFKSMYFGADDVEKALGRAYCSVLTQLGSLLPSAEFGDALQGGAQL